MLDNDFEPRRIDELEGLICHDCVFRTDKVSSCRMFMRNKPAIVFTGGRDTCQEYKREKAD